MSTSRRCLREKIEEGPSAQSDTRTQGWSPVREGVWAEAEGTAFGRTQWTALYVRVTGSSELAVGQSIKAHQGTGLGISSGRTSRNGAISWQLGNSKRRAGGTAFQGQPAAGAVGMVKQVPSRIRREHTALGSVNKYPFTWLPYNESR